LSTTSFAVTAGVGVGVRVGVGEGIDIGVGVEVGVEDGIGVAVGVTVGLAVAVAVGVSVEILGAFGVACDNRDTVSRVATIVAAGSVAGDDAGLLPAENVGRVEIATTAMPTPPMTNANSESSLACRPVSDRRRRTTVNGSVS
jgi:hypothetical protein